MDVGKPGAIPAFPLSPVLLVDGDIVAYRAAAAAEKTHYLVRSASGTECYEFDTAGEAGSFMRDGDVRWSRKEVLSEGIALNNLQSIMDAIARRFPESVIQVYLSGERNFRDAIWKTKKYKGNRTTERPKHLAAVQRTLVDRWFAQVSQNQEADDDIGQAHTGSDTVVASTDKDLDQLPGWHYNWVKEELYWVSPEHAEQFFWEQVISGDPVDNIPGLPGYGPVKARKFITDFYNHEASKATGIDEVVLDKFVSEGFDQSYFNEMVDLVRIKRNVSK